MPEGPKADSKWIVTAEFEDEGTRSWLIKDHGDHVEILEEG